MTSIVNPPNMHDDTQFTLGMPFLTGCLVLVSLFIAWYRQTDPLVSSHLALLYPPGAYQLNFPSSMLYPP